MFDVNNQLVKSYVLLIKKGEKEITDVPNFMNLRGVVEDAIAKANQTTTNTNQGDVFHDIYN